MSEIMLFVQLTSFSPRLSALLLQLGYRTVKSREIHYPRQQNSLDLVSWNWQFY